MKYFFPHRRWWPLGFLGLTILVFIGWSIATMMSKLHSQSLVNHHQLAEARQRLLASIDTNNLLHHVIATPTISRRASRDFQNQLNQFYESLDRQDHQASQKIIEAIKEKYPAQPELLLDWSLFHLLITGEQQKAAQGFVDLLEVHGSNQLEGMNGDLLNSLIEMYREAELWGAGVVFLDILSERDGGPSESEQLALGHFHFKLEQFEEALRNLQNLLQVSDDQVQDHLGSAQAIAAKIEMSRGETEQAIKNYFQAEHSLEKLINLKMRRGADFQGLVAEMEDLQFFMAHQLMSVKSLSVAESILLKLAEKFPSHPELVKLLDRIRLYKLEAGAG